MLKQTYARRVQPEVPARLAVVSTKNRMVAPHAGGDFTAPSFCYERERGSSRHSARRGAAGSGVAAQA